MPTLGPTFPILRRWWTWSRRRGCVHCPRFTPSASGPRSDHIQAQARHRQHGPLRTATRSDALPRQDPYTDTIDMPSPGHGHASDYLRVTLHASLRTVAALRSSRPRKGGCLSLTRAHELLSCVAEGCASDTERSVCMPRVSMSQGMLIWGRARVNAHTVHMTRSGVAYDHG